MLVTITVRAKNSQKEAIIYRSDLSDEQIFELNDFAYKLAEQNDKLKEDK